MYKKLILSILALCMALGLMAQMDVYIGSGTSSNGTTGAPTPYGTWYKAFRQQYLVLASEFHSLGIFGGNIHSIAFEVSALNNSTSMNNFRIRLKPTNQTALSSTFETGTYTQVFQANSFMPVVGWNSHTFSLPFVWDGTSNLLVDVVTDVIAGNYAQNASVYYSTTSFNSSLRFESDSSSGINASTGTTVRNRSNMRFTISGDSTGEPEFYVSPASHDFGDVNIGGSSSQSFNIVNIGGDGLGIQSITISGSSSFRLSGLPQLPLSLDSFSATSFNVLYTPLMLGTESAIITITDDLGGGTQHSISLSGSGINDITIGDGSQNARMPMDFYYKSSLYETIFTTNELNSFIGMITGLKLYNQFSSNLSEKPVKIWLGSTTQDNLANGWIPATEMTLVYDGVVDFPSGSNTISFVFPEPYLHLDGGNLAMMIQRPLDTNYFGSTDYFKTQTGNSTRARNMYSDTTNYDPYNPTGGSTTGTYPNITFVVIPGGVGHITGVVKNSGGQPLGGVAVTMNNNAIPQLTASDGSFAFVNLLPNDYHLAFHKHGFIDQGILVPVAEDETVELNITLQSMPQVAVSGRFIASDSLLGIAGVNITFTGYEDYSLQSGADGSFLLPQVYAFESYQYRFKHPGYTSIVGTLDLQGQNYSFGDIQMDELAFAPYNLMAAVSADPRAVALNWQSPNPNAVGIQESFENEQFPPANWNRIITNNGAMLSNGAYPHWRRLGEISSGSTLVSPSEGSFQAGLWWDYNFQDEWLITEDFTCPSDALLSFDTRVYLGSENGDSYMVKLSTDEGQSWLTLWDAGILSGGLNDYETPISLDISEYSGRRVRIAFHALSGDANDGLWHDWFIDNFMVISAFARTARGLEAYDAFRFTAANLHNPAAWQQLNAQPISGNGYIDSGWESLPQGDYYWAVKARYTNNLSSSAAISNLLSKSGGIPAAPQNLRLEIFGEDILLSWDAVTTDIAGSLLPIYGYEVYALSMPDEEPYNGNLIDITTETSYYILGATSESDWLFFVIKARGSE